MTEVIYTPIINNEKSIFYYKSNILNQKSMESMKQWLETHDYCNGYCISGKEIPRQQMWFQKDNHYFCNEWKSRYDRWIPQSEYPSILETTAKSILEEITPKLNEHQITIPTINSCLINKYRDGNDSIRAHRDTHLSFGYIPVIIGLSIGDSRILRIRKLHNPDTFKSLKVHRESDENIDFILEENSVFVMAGWSQKYFSHEVPKMPNKQTRYSLTFREYIV